MKICIVVPLYNEETIARQSIATILSYAKQLPPIVTVVAINDGSKDKTGSILDCLAQEYAKEELRVIAHESNQGYGAALRTGITFALEHHYDYVLFIDSDLTNHPKYLKLFYEKMGEDWDYIKATRYAHGGSVDGVPVSHQIISRVGNGIARILYGLPLTDFTNGFRAVKVSLMRQLHLTENGFVIIMEELFQAKNVAASFIEIPFTLTSRKKEQGKTHFSYSPQTCWHYLRYAIKSFFKRK